MAAFIFWLALFLIMFSYVGYAVVILVISWIVRNPVRRAPIEPTVTYLITAYNEEKNIAAKLEQTLSLDYPRDKLEIIVASDGSTDRTDDIVRGFADRAVRLLRVEGRVGKTETQNQAVRHATGDVIIFSDATTRYERSAIRNIVRNYADPSVGAVSGRYEYFNPTGAPIGVGSVLYGRYDNLIKTLQTSIKTITGCVGCIYSVRRSAYRPLPPEIISDLCEPLKVLESGHRVVFEPDAVAYEETTLRTAEEFRMRVRVITRGMNGLLFVKSLFNPLRYGFVSFQLFTHKVLRWLVPLFLSMALLANLFLLDEPFYRVTLAAQAGFYLIALIGYLAERGKFSIGPLSVPLYFVTVNLAIAVAMYRTWKGHKAVVWETVRR